MYKLEIEIGDWDWNLDKVTIETDDFEKAQIIQEFIEFQKAYGWAVDYDVTDEFVYNQEDETHEFHEDEDEDEEYVYDEDTNAWYWYDEDADTWYVYDEESDDWFEFVEEESEEEPEEESEEESDNVTHFVVTRIEE
jgi:hypothetical protein